MNVFSVPSGMVRVFFFSKVNLDFEFVCAQVFQQTKRINAYLRYGNGKEFIN